MYRIESCSETHSVSPDWPGFCSRLQHRWKNSMILDFSSSPSLFWRPFLSSSQSELQNYRGGDIKTQPRFSQQFELQNHFSVFQLHICLLNSSKICTNGRALRVNVTSCVAFFFFLLGLAAFWDTTNPTIIGTFTSLTWVPCWHAWSAKYHLWTDGLPWREQAEETREMWYRSREWRKTRLVIPTMSVPGKAAAAPSVSWDEVSKSVS